MDFYGYGSKREGLMTDNTNDAEKTPKPRTPRKPRKTADAVTPEVATDTGGAKKVQKSRAKPAEGASESGRARRTGSSESAGPVESVKAVEPVEMETEPAERVEVVAEAPDSGRTTPEGQAERDARAEWFERAERARREERTGWTPWTRPGERDASPGSERRDERVREERAGPDRDSRGAAGEALGSAAEEALKLFDTLQQRAARELRKNLIKGTMTGFGDAFSGGGRRRERDVWEEAVSGHEEEYICRACPVCRAMAAQRESGAAVTDHLMQAGTELFAAFKSAVDGLGKPAPGQRTREREGEEPPVEHIDLG